MIKLNCHFQIPNKKIMVRHLGILSDTKERLGYSIFKRTNCSKVNFKDAILSLYHKG